MDITSLVVFAVALAVASASPGPSVAALVARVLSKGHRDVFPFWIAMWIGEAIWLALAVLGLSLLAQTFQPLFLAIKWFGVGYLLFLAWKMWHAPVETLAEHFACSGSRWRLALAGFVVTMGNPKTMMFYVALLPTIVDLHKISIFGWLELTFAMFCVVIAIDLCWTLAASRARRFFTSRKSMKIANRTSAGMMAGAAVAVAVR
ncbi:LysE family translocator [Phyllobacterium sp. CCNWLW109]|uniref:LysE family translocator n=1 Tax=Phyllobacterium sp. CCNWLW109 TaxID=3127479 RepID=UPI0030768F30